MKNSINPQRFATLLAMLVLIVMAASNAHATAADTNNATFQAPFMNLVTAIFNLFNSGLLRILAILAIIGLGLSAMVGRLTWGLAIRVVVGIVLIFGAAAIVGLITGNGSNTTYSLLIDARALG